MHAHQGLWRVEGVEEDEWDKCFFFLIFLLCSQGGRVGANPWCNDFCKYSFNRIESPTPFISLRVFSLILCSGLGSVYRGTIYMKIHSHVK